jgi:aspartate racemase
MEQECYKGRLAGRHGLEVVPGEDDRALVHRVIYEELVQGRAGPSSCQA